MPLIGEALALGAAVLFAVGSIAIAKSSSGRSGESGVLLSVMMTGALAACGWLLAGPPVATGYTGTTIATAAAWFAGSGILATVWGRLTLFKSVEYAGVIRATTIRRLTPFFSVVLAWILLGEGLSPVGMAGMLLMAASFLFLVLDGRRKLEKQDKVAAAGLDIPRGYMFGMICALSYALSYVVRKNGLDLVPDAYLGALVGSLAALGYYLAGALVSPTFLAVARQAFDRPDPWHLLAALCISVGQIVQFLALTYTTVSAVAVINSVEIFIAGYLAVFVFRTEGLPSVLICLATVLAAIGVVLVALG